MYFYNFDQGIMIVHLWVNMSLFYFLFREQTKKTKTNLLSNRGGLDSYFASFQNKTKQVRINFYAN